MRYVPAHVKENRPAARDAASDPTRRTGLSVSAAFAMIRKDIQELRRQASRPHVEPAVLEQQLHEITAQIDAVQNASPSRDGSGRGMDEFVAHLQTLLTHNETRLAALQQQIASSAAEAISGPAESIRRDVASLKEIQASADRRTQDMFEVVYDTIERIVDRLATLEEELRDRHAGSPPADASPTESARCSAPPARLTHAPEAPAPSPASTRGPGMSIMLRQPAVPDLKAQVPARLAPIETESDLCPVPLTPVDAGLVAARRAAQALASAAPAGPLSALRRLRGKTAVLGVTGVLATLFAITFALDFYHSPDATVADPLPSGAEDKVVVDADLPAGDTARPAETPLGQPVRQGSSSAPSATGSANPLPDNAAPAQQAAVPDEFVAPTVAQGASQGAADAAKPDGEVSPLMRSVLLPAPAGDPWRSAPSPAQDLTATPLSPAIGSKALVAAASAGDPCASYEIGVRFAQGHNAPQDLAMAAAWMDRAARAGLAPAQFRLGTMYEKGLGVRKDLAEARRLYTAAAAKGHAKAMHNLATLYSGGVDGAPDFAAAAEWFRKAAAYGVVDSQYNLAILYARGNGVERDLAESYKWFALAAKAGDKDSAHKRDEIARGLDQKHLEGAKQAAEAFIATPQPDEAIAIRAPAGGWDHVATAATTKSRPLVRPERFPGR
jgi:localization factor PodJL